jgi:hypothetical protein
MSATEWQSHGAGRALAWALKKKPGVTITSESWNVGERVYRITE